MLTIVQVRDDLLSKLGIEDPADAEDLQLQDVVIAINGAFQTLKTAGQEYFTRETLSLGYAAGTALLTIPQDVQAVIGPIRWNNILPLRALDSRGQYDEFDRIFMRGSGFGPGVADDPVAYFVENLRKSTDTGDINQINIYLAPIPIGAGTIVVDVINDAVPYDVEDLDEDIVLPVAQNYTESIFLPLARFLITRSSQFSRPDLLDSLTADGQTALQRLGLAGGFPPSQQPQPPRETEA